MWCRRASGAAAVASLCRLALVLLLGAARGSAGGGRGFVARLGGLSLPPEKGRPSAAPGVAAGAAPRRQDLVVAAAGRRNATAGRGGNGSGRGARLGRLGRRSRNRSANAFASCGQACDRCFVDHYQGCLAYCSIGCEDYCDTVLPRPECEAQEQWWAEVSHIFNALHSAARMCQATGLDGCPVRPTLAPPNHPPLDSLAPTPPESDDPKAITEDGDGQELLSRRQQPIHAPPDYRPAVRLAATGSSDTRRLALGGR